MADVGDVQDAEMADLKEKYGRQCRIMKDVGDFKHVVDIRPSDLDVSIKFQLSDTYPVIIPDIFVMSKKLLPEAVHDLQSHLVRLAGKLTGDAMIHKLYQSAKEWLEEQGLDITVEAKPSGAKKNAKTKKGKKGKKVEEEELKEEKKVSMKTADDVIKRIRWDEAVNSDDFRVGYLDRFKGVIEKSFSAFTWEDIASADYHELAIPKHRIQYFKYKKVKFWDKEQRMDDMFGSTGSGITITDVIAKYEAQKLERGDDEDSEDDFEIVTGEEGGGEEEKKKDNAYKRPNYFFCVRVKDPEILEGVEAMQDHIVDDEEKFNDCCIQLEKLHITLCTVGLDTQEQIDHACHFLAKAKDDIAKEAKKKIRVKLDGVNHFLNRVLYAEVEYNPDFIQFSHHFRELVKEADIDMRDSHDFIPHMTIMKLSRPGMRSMGTTKIKPEIYERYLDMYFGYQEIDAVYLCPMTADHREDGFYPAPASINLLE